MRTSYGNIVRNNVIHNTYYPGILVYGADGKAPNIIEGNIIWASDDNAIQAAADAIIRNNVIFGGEFGDGLASYNHQSASPGNLTIVHNSIFSHQDYQRALNITYPTGGAFSGPILIANNALYDSSQEGGLALRYPLLPDITLRGNVGSGDIEPDSPPPLATSWNPIGSLATDFVNAQSYNAFPNSSSALIDAANISYQTHYDFNGSSRINSADSGAFVYSASNPGWVVDISNPGFKAINTVDVDTDSDGIADYRDNCTLISNPKQIDSNHDGYGNACDADLNNDGATNTLDLNLYRIAHRTVAGDPAYNADADFNSDGKINTLDLNLYRNLHRKKPGPSTYSR